MRIDKDKGIAFAALKMVNSHSDFVQQLLGTKSSIVASSMLKKNFNHMFLSHAQKDSAYLCRSLYSTLKNVGIK